MLLFARARVSEPNSFCMILLEEREAEPGCRPFITFHCVAFFFGGGAARASLQGVAGERRLGFPCSRSEKSSAFQQHEDAHYLAERREQMTEQTRRAALSCSTAAPAKCVDLMAFAGNQHKLPGNLGFRRSETYLVFDESSSAAKVQTH